MKEELKILMLEDQEDDAGLIDRVLKREKFTFTRKRVDTEDEFINALLNYKPDIILSDHSLPQFNSLDALKICKSKNVTTPFILVTGAVSEEFAVNCLKRGADDYVLKSNLSRLPSAIRNALQQHQTENNKQQQEELLRAQNEELIKINKELDAFVYSVSHNLRSPLSSVIGLVNLAKLDKNKDVQTLENYLEMVEKSVLKLDETLKEILEYSRNARGEFSISEINLESLIECVFDQLKYLKGQEKIRKETKINSHTKFYSDEHRLSMILINLISNAIKYRDETKNCHIIVSATVTPAQALIEVQDNGIGIDPGYLPKVFNMFYRATEKSEGAGLGLYIVKEIVEKLKGELRISSDLGERTTISFTIPNELLKVEA